jgi:AcrR family transcriptional regulator
MSSALSPDLVSAAVTAQQVLDTLQVDLAYCASVAYDEAMSYAPVAPGPASMRRRDWQKEQTRLDLALAAFELARAEGLANVRVPQIAEACGVSTRTFNNYFSSKEAAIVWPTSLRGARLAAGLAERPAGESLGDALVEVVAGLYGPAGQEGLPEGWLDGFRVLVAAESALHGEYLKAQAAGERALAEVIAVRTGAADGALEPLLVAGVVVAAERAAVLHWFRQGNSSTPMVEVVRNALRMAVGGMTVATISLR